MIRRAQGQALSDLLGNDARMGWAAERRGDVFVFLPFGDDGGR
jgi:hypothetical protein